MDTPNLYIWIEKVHPTGCTFKQEVQALWDKLPTYPPNKAYLEALCHPPQPPHVIAQRMTALGCLLQALDAVCPAALPHLTLHRAVGNKPFVTWSGVDALPLSFSLSHTQNMAVCALGVGMGDVGVDIEPVMSDERGAKIAQRFFTKEENAWLAMQESFGIGLGATRIWTAKEALFKCGGYGALLDCNTACLGGEKQLLSGMLSDMVVSVCMSRDVIPQMLATPTPVLFQKTNFQIS